MAVFFGVLFVPRPRNFPWEDPIWPPNSSGQLEGIPSNDELAARATLAVKASRSSVGERSPSNTTLQAILKRYPWGQR